MSISTGPDRLDGSPSRPLTSITGFARRSFASLSREQAQAVLQERPDPVSMVRRPGPDPYQVLLFGGGVLQGVGLRDHDLGLPGRIADEIVTRQRRGVQLDIVVDPRSTAPGALALLAGLRLRRYDAVVVVLGENDSTHPVAAHWRGALVGLTKLLMTETCPCAGLFLLDSSRAMAPVSTLPPGLRSGAAADRLVPIVEEVCELAPRMRFGEFPSSVLAADPVRGFADGTYRDWAAWIVDRLAPSLSTVDDSTDENRPKHFRNRPQDERLRQRAVDSLRLRTADQHEELDREVRQAKQLYRAGSAALTIVDGEITWMRATTDSMAFQVSRSLSFCDLGVRSDGLLLINDTWRDPRTVNNPLAQGPEGIRFYAGYPVRTWDGYRVGMLCVHGPTPRTLLTRDLEGLRDIAARVEGILRRDALRLRLR